VTPTLIEVYSDGSGNTLASNKDFKTSFLVIRSLPTTYYEAVALLDVLK
jgi:hypothetical protein